MPSYSTRIRAEGWTDVGIDVSLVCAKIITATVELEEGTHLDVVYQIH